MKARSKATVASAVNDPLELIREHCPSLVVARASFLPFDDVISGEHGGSKAGTPYFALVVFEQSEFETWIVVTASTVTIETIDHDLEDGSYEVLDSFKTTLSGAWDFLRQLPRPASAFRRKR